MDTKTYNEKVFLINDYLVLNKLAHKGVNEIKIM